MTQTTLTVSSPLTRGDLQERFLDPILAAWPRGDGPEGRCMPLEELLEERESAAPGRGRVQGPCLIAMPAREDAPDLRPMQLVDRLRQAYVPTVLLFEQPSDQDMLLEGDGVLIERADACAGDIARTLHALAAGEAAVRQLRLELHAASAVHGGLQGEMDRLHDEMNLAATVQREMIPRALPEPEGVHVSVLFRPCGYVSGDIYDAVMLDDRHMAFLVADAVGHGVPAALLTMVISKGLRKTEENAHGEAVVIEPGEAFERLNAEMCARQGASPRFATAVYGIIDRATGRVRLAGAGHPPPMIVSSDGLEPRYVETEGPLLGVFDGAEFEQVEFDLAPGETMLMYSDGFETAFPKPGSEGDDIRLPTQTYLQHLAEMAEAGKTSREALGEAVGKLERLLDEQVGSLHQPDDVTAMAISIASDGANARKAA